MRRDSARRETAARVQGIRHGLHAREPAGRMHGFERRCLCCALQLRTLASVDVGACNRMSAIGPGYARPLDFRNGCVDMSHGAGGRAMAQLIEELFAQAFDNEWLRQMNDQARFDVPSGRMVMSTDSHVVSPLFFPGGDIGS